MATTTKNYNLTKPLPREKVDINVINNNMDIIDANFKNLSDNKADINDLTSHISNKNNPHNVTKSQIGLGDVENKSSDTIRSEITKSNVTTALGYTPPTSNTTNTAGSTNTSSKIFLVGATSQATNPQTYSHDTAYVGTDGCLYSNNKLVTTTIYSSTEPTSNLDTGTIWIG